MFVRICLIAILLAATAAYAQPTGAELTFTTGRAWFGGPTGTLWGGAATLPLHSRISLEGSAVTSNVRYQTVLEQNPRYRSRTLISGGVAVRAGAQRAYWFAGAGPGAFRGLEGDWTSTLTGSTGVVLAPVGRTIIRAEVFGAWKREWLVKGVKVGFGFRL